LYDEIKFSSSVIIVTADKPGSIFPIHAHAREKMANIKKNYNSASIIY
jgi:hypothetical protein